MNERDNIEADSVDRSEDVVLEREGSVLARGQLESASEAVEYAEKLNEDKLKVFSINDVTNPQRLKVISVVDPLLSVGELRVRVIVWMLASIQSIDLE